MSLGRKLSEVRARYEEARRTGDVQAIDDLTAANMPAMLDALDRYDRALNVFADQRWARAQMRQACDDFGVEPPPEIGKA
jgi:hypothetical protein